MGTTLTASAVVGGTLVAAHIGDCRLFLSRDGKLEQLTKDHTWVWEQMQYGLLSPEDARAHPRRNMLTRCLGRELIVGIDVLSMDLRPRDIIVQCSDGVHVAVREEEVAELVVAHPPEAACRALVRRARGGGGGGNPSVQGAGLVSCPPAAPPSSWRARRGPASRRPQAGG